MSKKQTKSTVPASHYVGIGASAGGLEAIQELVKYLPDDTGAAFIVVQHLSPDHKSMMDTLLARYTTMPIKVIADGMEIEANHIYLLPPRKNLLTAEGKLFLSDYMPDGHVHMPIDVFLRSLSEDQQHRAIGVILSGTGTDGTRGIKAIKESAGLVIVQEPSTAEFDGMPSSAVNTGKADFVLPPENIGHTLAAYISHPSISDEGTAIAAANVEQEPLLNEIFTILRQKSSINFTLYKASTVARRIKRRLGINQLINLEEYCQLLRESPREVQILSKELLIGVTRFFRDDEAYKDLITTVIPNIVSKHKDQPIRVWVAGCSTGEEAYSMSVLFFEEIEKQESNSNLKIFATDVDDDAIGEASSGIFSLDIEQDVGPERLARHFEKTGTGYRISRDIRQAVIFSTHNMIEDPPFSNIQLVSCRNVLIYFQLAAQKKVLASLYFALRKNGYLFLGSSETLGEFHNHFETLKERSKIYQKVSNRQIPLGSAPPQFSESGRRQSGLSAPPLRTFHKQGKLENQLHFDVLEKLVRNFAPDCILLNEELDAVHVYGDVHLYTKGISDGRITHNIKDMLVDDLSVAISTALYRCERNAEDVFYKDVRISNSKGEPQLLDLSVLLVSSGEGVNAPRFYVVQFIPTNEDSSNRLSNKPVHFDVSAQARQRIADLEKELVLKQESLQVTIEELETTNEELQSANEELMSANEELQSTNEELQSVNEELYTVNSEYQEKISELTQANNDLDSVLSATDIGIIFLDDQLTIRKFTKTAQKFVNLRPEDENRPIHHISHSMKYEDFLYDIDHVSDKDEIIEKNVHCNDGQTVLVTIRPYLRRRHHTRSGVLITITNISRLRFVENALATAQEQLRNTVQEQNTQLHHRLRANEEVKVLVLDDDKVDLKHIERVLDGIPDRSYAINLCQTVKKAVEFAKSTIYDVFIVDYRLSGNSTAKDFIEELKSLNIDTPVIILSGYADADMDLAFLSDDIFDFINKNELSGQLLVRSIDYIIERNTIHRTIEEFGVEP